MYRLALDWQQAALRPCLAGARVLADAVPHGAPLRATFDHWLANLTAGAPRTIPLSQRIAWETGLPVHDETLADDAFVRVARLTLDAQKSRRQVLIVAPYSGYAIDVAASLAAGLLASFDLIVTEWRDARLVPLLQGRFGLAEQIATLMRVLREAGPEVDVVALSQGTVPALAAAALLAEEGGPAARSLALLGGPIDPAHNPPPATVWLLAVPPECMPLAFNQAGARDPADGRWVLPGLAQLVLIAMSHPAAYVQAQTGAWLEALDGRADGWSRNLADLHAVMDTPAELVSDMMSLVYRERALAAGTLQVLGRPVRPELLETALLTLEAGDDALVGHGQTHAAHALCPRIAEDRRARLTLEGGQHYDLFSGPRAAREVVPALEGFYARLT